MGPEFVKYRPVFRAGNNDLEILEKVFQSDFVKSSDLAGFRVNRLQMRIEFFSVTA